MNEPLGVDRRKLFGGFVVLGGLALLLGLWSLRQSILSPFSPASQVAQQSGEPSEELRHLQSQDTDDDGLNDYAELYTHATSPYVGDSDSDGLSDKEEIDAGSDPNCPKGQDCLGTGLTNAPPSTAPVNQSVPATQAVDPQLLRETLRDAGAPQNVLDATSDAELLQLYQETVGETPQNGDTLSSLENLTPAEVRQLLIENGASKEELEKIDDQSLMAVFQEALQEQQ